MKSKKIIPIFFAVDDNYAPYLAAALESLKDCSSDKYIYDVNVLVEKISQTHVDNILSIGGGNIKITFINVTDKVLALCSKLHLRDYYTRATYYRFFIPDMFPQYDKGLYLDCDIIITRDVADMYNIPTDRNLLCAVNDEIISDVEVFARYSEVVLDIPRNKYFNAGILVMNLAEMRAIHIEGLFADLLSKKTYSVAQDQDYLNVICYGKVKLLNTLWNKTPMPYSDKSTIPYIAHYKINYKPWKYDNVVYGDLFWKYAKKTPYYSALLEAKKSFTEADIAVDAEQYASLERLAEKETHEELLSQSAFFGDEFFPLNFWLDTDEYSFVSAEPKLAEAM